MRLRPAKIRKRPFKINTAVEMQAPIILDIDVQSLEVGGRVNETDLFGLDEAVGDDDAFLIRGHFDVVAPMVCIVDDLYKAD